MSKHLRWGSHKDHWELLKEFYYLNKYLITEQLKDALLDAMECMEYTMIEEGESYKEEDKKYHMPKAVIQMAEWIYDGDCMIASCCNTAYDIDKFARKDEFIYVPCKCPNCGCELRPPQD